jgi:hypothetical protein
MGVTIIFWLLSAGGIALTVALWMLHRRVARLENDMLRRSDMIDITWRPDGIFSLDFDVDAYRDAYDPVTDNPEEPS